MEANRLCLFSSSSSSSSSFSYLMILVSSVFLSAGLSASSFISDDIFASQASVGRNLLQAKKDCPINFEYKNYTIIKSQCKGPNYLPKPCCDSLKEFACPYAEELNDLSNNCAETMFSYITLNGPYPPGLFSSFCSEGKQGIECPALPPSQSADANAGGVVKVHNPFLILLLLPTSAFLVCVF